MAEERNWGPVSAVSFDCANTLLEGDWNPVEFAHECAAELELELDLALSVPAYAQLLRTRWAHYCELNETRNRDACRSFWRQLTADWLQASGSSLDQLDQLIEIADSRLFGPRCEVFRMFDDVLPALDELKAQGVPMIVLSNWDYSLHEAIRRFELQGYFEFCLASLEEGVEKPDQRLFQIAESRLGHAPGQILHVGDNPTDDFDGARAAGWQAVLLDRTCEESSPARIRSMAEVAARLDA